MELRFIKYNPIFEIGLITRSAVFIRPALNRITDDPNLLSNFSAENPNAEISESLLYEKQIHFTMLVKNTGALTKRKGV